MKLGSTPRVRHLTMALASATAAIGFNGFLSASQGEVNMQAPAGETRFWVEEVASDLDRPWEMTWLPNGDMLLTERPGRLRIVQYGKLLPNVVTGMPEVLSTSMFDGLLEVKADPDFASNGMLYLTYTTGEDNARVGHIMKAHYVNGALTDQKVIFTTAVPAPAGGPNIMRILFLPDKTMFVGMGSGG